MSDESLVIVRDRAEIDAALASGLGEATFLCTSGPIADVCAKKNLRHTVLDEGSVKEDYRAINQWAMDRSLFFIERAKKDPARRRFLEFYFYDVKDIFIRCLKYLLVLEKALSVRSARLVLFEKKGSLLELTCRHYAEATRPSIRVETLPGTAAAVAVRGPFVKRIVQKIFGRLAGAWTHIRLSSILKKGTKAVIFSGSLGHLARLADVLKAKGAAVVWCESSFNLEKFTHCLRRGIPFVVLPELENPRNPFELNSLCESPDKIQWRGQDLTALYNKAFAALLEVGLLNRGFDPEAVEKMLAEISPSSLVLDEDIAVRRVFTILARERGIRRFVVSHSVPTVEILQENERPKGIFYDTALTLVNSEHEKKAYESSYYDPANIAVTGTPRYDDLYRIKENRSRQRSKQEKRDRTILYCGQTTFHYDFEQHWAADLMGARAFHWDLTRTYVKDVLAEAQARPGTFVRIKPHYWDPRPWEELTSSARLAGFCEFLSHDADIFKLLEEADVVITMPSSVICEAIALEKPVILMDYGREETAARYERREAVQMARSKKELGEALDRCFKDATGKKRIRQYDHFTGPFDGHNTARVAERILNG